MKKIKNLTDLAHWFGITHKTFKAQIERALYKGSDCGMFSAFEKGKFVVGSIVEGVDFGTETHKLKYPFSTATLNKTLEAIENEAHHIWEQTHGCEDCGIEGEWGHPAINPNCKSCKGEGVII